MRFATTPRRPTISDQFSPRSHPGRCSTGCTERPVEGGEKVYIGSITLESQFVASEFGDRILAFQHAWPVTGVMSCGGARDGHNRREPQAKPSRSPC